MIADLAVVRGGVRRPGGPDAEHVGEGQAGPERADLQEVAAGDAVAEPLLVAPDGQHDTSPNGEKAGGRAGKTGGFITSAATQE